MTGGEVAVGRNENEGGLDDFIFNQSLCFHEVI